jgi:hypothetical protein
MASPIDTWHAGGPSLVELRDRAFDEMKAAAVAAIREGRETVEVNARDLIALRTTAEAYEEMEAEAGRPSRKRHDHSSTDPWSSGPNGDTAYIDGCPIS